MQFIIEKRRQILFKNLLAGESNFAWPPSHGVGMAALEDGRPEGGRSLSGSWQNEEGHEYLQTIDKSETHVKGLIENLDQANSDIDTIKDQKSGSENQRRQLANWVGVGGS
jgi:hypothetical protein